MVDLKHVTLRYESILAPLNDQTALWIGLPTSEPDRAFNFVLAPGCDLGELYTSQTHPHALFLSLDMERLRTQELKLRLGALIGPFDVIVLSKEFLSRNAYMIGSMRVALLKLCHHSSQVMVEGAWRSFYGGGSDDSDGSSDDSSATLKRPTDHQRVDKVLSEISQVIARSLPRWPVGKTSLSRRANTEDSMTNDDPRSHWEDRLRHRWQGITRAQAETRKPNLEAKRNLENQAKSVAIIGGGIAGVTLALELFKRGHVIELFEADSELLNEGSSQPLLATYPQFSKEANSLSLLTQYSLQLLARSPYAHLINFSGRFQPATSPSHADTQKALVHRLGLAPELLQYLSPAEAASHWRAFHQTTAPSMTQAEPVKTERPGGLWMSLGGNLNVNEVRKHVLKVAEENPRHLKLQLGQRTSLSAVVNHFQSVILAAGQASPNLLGNSPIHARLLERASWNVFSGSSFSVRAICPTLASPTGLTSTSKASQRTKATLGKRAIPKAPRSPIFGGAVSLQTLGEGEWLIGSSYFDAKSQAPSEASQWDQLVEGARVLTGDSLNIFVKQGVHSGPRCTVRDRMPLIGPLARSQEARQSAQIYLATAFGSRGLLWAHLAAQLIADHIEGISPRVGMKALKSIDALRYAERPKSAFDE